MFKRKQQPAHVCETTYDDVVGYLRDMAQPDYTKILKVVKLYRDADKGVKKVLNIKDQPADEEGFTDAELDDLFMLDDQDTPASKKQRETAQKATKPAKKITVKE